MEIDMTTVTQQSELTRVLAGRPGFDEGYEAAMRQKRFGALLRTLREEQGLSQKALAERAGVDQGDISRFEAGKWGKRGVSFEMLDRILPVLGLRLEHQLQVAGDVILSPASMQTIEAMGAAL